MEKKRTLQLVHICTLFAFVNAKTESNINQRKGLAEVYDKLMLHIENKTNYDSRIRPLLDEKPLEITVSMHVSSLRSISEATMDFKLELYFREQWQDPRLAYRFENSYNLPNGSITIHESMAKQLWLPDTFMPNAISSENPDYESISHRVYVRLDPHGHVLFSRRISVTAECPMDLSFYPFDTQVCILTIESYGHAVEDIIYKWLEKNPVILFADMQLPDFVLNDVRTNVQNISLSTGIYSHLDCCFIFSRKAGFYYIQLFLPATAIVVTSWILLWLEIKTELGDMIAVILAITYLYFSYTAIMPGVTYIKATDIFLGFCFLSVFLAFVKLAIYKHKLIKQGLPNFAEQLNLKGRCDLRSEFHFVEDEKTNEAIVTTDTSLRKDGQEKKCCKVAKNIHNNILENKTLSFMIFPVSFIIFCFFYFLAYLVLLNDQSRQRCNF